jgi:hypothetical protein
MHPSALQDKLLASPLAPDDARQLGAFLLPMLAVDPAERADAATMLKHAYLGI